MNIDWNYFIVIFGIIELLFGVNSVSRFIVSCFKCLKYRKKALEGDIEAKKNLRDELEKLKRRGLIALLVFALIVISILAYPFVNKSDKGKSDNEGMQPIDSVPAPETEAGVTLVDSWSAIDDTDNTQGASEPPRTEAKSNSNSIIIGADYDGDYNDQGIPNDEDCKIKYDNGNNYEGSVVDGKKCGHGVMTYYNGDIYDGDWKDDMRHGCGVYTWDDGRAYDGEFRRDMLYGEGTYTGWSGTVGENLSWSGTYDGQFANGVFHGKGTFYIENGDICEGEFAQGKIVSGTYTTENGIKQQIIDGKLMP